MTRTAYKYRNWEDIHTKRIITHQELYFADPTTFNDLFDCQAYGFIGNYQFANNPIVITGDGKVHRLDGNPNDLMNWSVRKYIAKCGVCCFSKSYNSILMWAHYADYNRGVCFRFDLDKIEIENGLFGDIFYVKKKPLCDYSEPKSEEYKWFFYKNRVWKYEKEVRGLIFPPQIIKDEQYRTITFPKEALKEIIFGANSTKSTREEVICLCHQYGFNKVKFTIIKATTDSDSYKLMKVPFVITENLTSQET